MNTLQDLDPRWDNQTLNYDLAKHNWPEYWLGVAQEKFPQITELETVHKILTPDQISELGRHCQMQFDTEELQNRIDAYYSDYIPQLVDQNDWMI